VLGEYDDFLKTLERIKYFAGVDFLLQLGKSLDTVPSELNCIPADEVRNGQKSQEGSVG
jgi:hypothetical protein